MSLNRPNSVTTNQHRRAIGTFPNRNSAEHALHELRDSGFSMDRVSVVAQDSDRNDTIAGSDVRDRADNKADDGAKVGALSGGALGGLTGLLVGIGALAIPGLGPIMLAGAAATALATTAAGTAIGAAAGSLLGGLIGLGIPEERAKIYSDRVSAGQYLVMVDGTDAEIAHAERILNHRGIEEWGVYDIPAAEAANHSTASVMPAAAVPPAIATEEAARKFDERQIKARQPVVNQNAENINLYEERLVVDKDREKTGEVAIGKHIETETARASIPIERERVVIERHAAGDGTAVTPGNDAFHDETMRVEVYEEAPDIHKEAFVREEVNIRKEVDRENVNVEETLRREELTIDKQGHPVVETRPDNIRRDRA
ncbi:DUF2382 domain-containing protein [Leptolyngbyaceae cyanobacterium UHCC 1019]